MEGATVCLTKLLPACLNVPHAYNVSKRQVVMECELINIRRLLLLYYYYLSPSSSLVVIYRVGGGAAAAIQQSTFCDLPPPLPLSP